ncbi:histidine phosphatase family protein [Micromonospora sp. WMMD1120]|uniref:histidine phosphatase family protein n=1 Tax=Micromonospora sp. WMMD1120 TaxID=3016106 RepID=UPI0024166D94|nr:histidine phosphatase family protein [Micromonospora sp. WMMD1120]MDG4809645.1 histidine phosphatase family protein [Micromonospora sp. WMMD1120]
MTATSLRLVAHGHTAALRRARFGAMDDALDEGGRRAARALAESGRAAPLGVYDTVGCSPAVAATQTAVALGLPPTQDVALADCDYGDWAGRSFEEIADEQPLVLREWMSSVDAAPHGGESVTMVRHRIGRWLDERITGGRRTVAVTHPLVIRLAVVHALDLPLATYRQVDVEPLAVVRLTSQGTRWQLRLGPPIG